MVDAIKHHQHYAKICFDVTLIIHSTNNSSSSTSDAAQYRDVVIFTWAGIPIWSEEYQHGGKHITLFNIFQVRYWFNSCRFVWNAFSKVWKAISLDVKSRASVLEYVLVWSFGIGLGLGLGLIPRWVLKPDIIFCVLQLATLLYLQDHQETKKPCTPFNDYPRYRSTCLVGWHYLICDTVCWFRTIGCHLSPLMAENCRSEI